MAAITSCIFQIIDRYDRNKVEHKLVYESTRMIIPPSNRGIEGISLGILLRNLAKFPLILKSNLSTRELHYKIPRAGFSPPKTDSEINTISIPDEGMGFVDDYRIPLPPDLTGQATAEIHCKLVYGKPGKLDYELEINKISYLTFKDSTVSGGETWYDR